MCGLAGYSGSSKVNPQSMRILLWDNEVRGRQSTGIFGNKVYKAPCAASSFITRDNFDRHVLANEVISHTRMSSVGAVNGENAHPFIVSNKDRSSYLVGAHNGTLIPESFEQIKNVIKESGHFEHIPEVDSLALFQYLAVHDFDLSKINDIYGHMALCFVHKGELHLYRRESRPLYIACKKNKMYFSSREEGLMKIGINENLIEELPPFVVYSFKDGRNTNQLDLGKPMINVKDSARTMSFWRRHCDESYDDVNSIFPEKKNIYNNNSSYQNKNIKKIGSGNKSNQSSIFDSKDKVTHKNYTETSPFDTFTKPRWLPNHAGEIRMVEGKLSFSIHLDDSNDVTRGVSMDDKNLKPGVKLSKSDAKLSVKVRVDQNGKLKSLNNIKYVLLKKDGLSEKRVGVGGTIKSGGITLDIGLQHINQEMILILFNNSSNSIVYRYEVGSLLGGRAYNLDIKIPCFEEEFNKEDSFKVEVIKERDPFSIKEEETENNNLILFDDSNVKDEDELINKVVSLSDEDFNEYLKEKLGGVSQQELQKKMIVSNKESCLSLIDDKISQGEDVVSGIEGILSPEDLSNSSVSSVIDVLKSALEYVQQDISRLSKDKEVLKSIKQD